MSSPAPASSIPVDARHAPAAPWLDVPRLIEHSLPRGGGSGAVRLLVFLPPIGLAGLVTAVLLIVLSPGRSLWLPLAALASLGASAGAMFALARLAKLAQAERRQVAQVDELVTLRHFEPAALRLAALLGRPMRMRQNRVLALVQLARVLMRYERFDETVDVADAVLRDPLADPGTLFAVGCGRVMALLRAGRLFDAGEAISGLRREVNRLDGMLRRMAEAARPEARGRASEAAAEPDVSDSVDGSEDVAFDEMSDGVPRQAFDSAALTLVELYRDIQTRHSDEALASFDSKRNALRDGLGVRMADAMALAALAAQRLDQRERAASLWADATALLPAQELRRRYPELSELDAAMPDTPRPGERGAP